MPKKKEAKKEESSVTSKAVPRAKKFKLLITVNDLEHKEDTNDIHQSFVDFVSSPDFPVAIKTNVFIKVNKGKAESQRVFHVPEARRVFSLIANYPSALEILANKLVDELN